MHHLQESLGESATWVSFLESRTRSFTRVAKVKQHVICFWCGIFELFGQHPKKPSMHVIHVKTKGVTTCALSYVCRRLSWFTVLAAVAIGSMMTYQRLSQIQSGRLCSLATSCQPVFASGSSSPMVCTILFSAFQSGISADLFGGWGLGIWFLHTSVHNSSFQSFFHSLWQWHEWYSKTTSEIIHAGWALRKHMFLLSLLRTINLCVDVCNLFGALPVARCHLFVVGVLLVAKTPAPSRNSGLLGGSSHESQVGYNPSDFSGLTLQKSH